MTQLSKLVGTCNRCGLCCYADGLRCANLLVDGEPGTPQATRCGVYKVRTPGMPILLLTTEGKVGSIGHCAHGTAMDDIVILPHIGKGCSLTLRS